MTLMTPSGIVLYCLQVSTNPEQYQMCLDIVNHLILFVDPKKNESERFRRNLSLELAKKSKQEVRETIETKQVNLVVYCYIIIIIVE